MTSDTMTVNGQTVEVPATPLNSSVTISTILPPRIRAERDCVVLELDRGTRILGVLVLTWGLVAASLAIMAVVRDWHLFAKLICIGQGVFLPIMGLFFIILPSTHEFDLRTGLYRRQSAINPQVRPLTDIVGVQAIRGPVMEATPEEMSTSRQSYQLNLVVDGGSRRVVVTCMIDDSWVAEAGRAVSGLLGVPFIGTLATRPISAAGRSSK